jgi:hypothetical protein
MGQALSAFPKNPVSFALERTRASILESLSSQGVTVLRDQLRDNDLLKRHVLKRCIYGVDLNPMAVELAKVSLWLDAFTLGAPLSFLDHHLRCGNSLVGATIDELKKATVGQLFRLDYEPLLRAINYVLLVSKIADATAAEVADSVMQYSKAREALSGYQIILDLLLADNFGMPLAKAMITSGSDLDVSDREKLLASLHSEKERKLVAEVDTLAKRPDRRFFHWDVEFPEVFFGFADADQRQIEHKERIKAGSAGFDVVIGNPPYDVLSVKELGESVRDLISYVRASPRFSAALGRKLNLYRCFLANSFGILKSTGKCGMIIPMGITGDLSASAIRTRLVGDCTLREILAFPQKDDPKRRIFPDAKLSTCVILHGLQPSEFFRLRGYPANLIQDPFCDVNVPFSSISLLDPESLSIPLADQHSYEVLLKIYSDPSIHPLSDLTRCYQGEINLSTWKSRIGTNSQHARLIKGAEIGRFAVRPTLRQGERQYFNTKGFSHSGEKAKHRSLRRLIMQGITGVDDSRRLTATIEDPPFYCGHSCNYITKASPYSLEALLVLLNGSLMEWRFRLTSTNNNVNSYEIHGLPIPCKLGNPDLPVSCSYALSIENAEAIADDLRLRLDGTNAWDRIVQIHGFLSQYGLLRLRVGETSDQRVASADEAIDRLVWAAYGLSDANRSTVLEKGYIVGGSDGEAEDSDLSA